MKNSMANPKFSKTNRLAEEAVIELSDRLVPADLTDTGLNYDNADDIISVYRVLGEPRWGVRFIIISTQNLILEQIISGSRNISTLEKDEWNKLLSPSPSNTLLFHYFRKVHNAFKTNARSSRSYDSAYDEICRVLKEIWELGNKQT